MPQPKSSDGRSPEDGDGHLGAALGALRDLAGKGVLISAELLHETFEQAVARGRMTRQDAEELASNLVEIGRRHAQDTLAEAVERVRRAAGLATVPPIDGYDDLTAAQVQQRLAALDEAQLRAVREHELRNANRVSVLRAIDRRLG